MTATTRPDPSRSRPSRSAAVTACTRRCRRCACSPTTSPPSSPSADDGGSSGRLRRELGLLPPGDLRMALGRAGRPTTTARDRRVARRSSQHRFGGIGALAGHAVGNLLLAGPDRRRSATRSRRSTRPCRPARRARAGAADEPAAAGHRGRRHRARDADPERARTASAARSPSRRRRAACSGCGCVPDRPRACPEAVDAVRAADVVILGPGSWFTSVLPHLLVPELRDALIETAARRVVVLNLAPQPGETAGFSPEQHLAVLCEHAPALRVDVGAGRRRRRARCPTGCAAAPRPAGGPSSPRRRPTCTSARPGRWRARSSRSHDPVGPRTGGDRRGGWPTSRPAPGAHRSRHAPQREDVTMAMTAAVKDELLPARRHQAVLPPRRGRGAAALRGRPAHRRRPRRRRGRGRHRLRRAAPAPRHPRALRAHLRGARDHRGRAAPRRALRHARGPRRRGAGAPDRPARRRAAVRCAGCRRPSSPAGCATPRPRGGARSSPTARSPSRAAAPRWRSPARARRRRWRWSARPGGSGVTAKAREVRGADRVVVRDGDAIGALLTRMGAHDVGAGLGGAADAPRGARHRQPPGQLRRRQPAPLRAGRGGRRGAGRRGRWRSSATTCPTTCWPRAGCASSTRRPRWRSWVSWPTRR